MAVAADPDLNLEPDLERAHELAREYNVIPVSCRFVEDTETPVSAFLKLRGEGPAFLLESAEQGRLGRYSFLGFRPRAILRWSAGTLSEWSGGELDPAARPSRTVDAPDPYAAVSEYLSRFRVAEIEGLPPFAGGAVGFFGYDLVRTVEPLSEPNPDPLGLPDMALMITETLVCFDHQRHELTVLAHTFVDDHDEIAPAYGRAVAAIEQVRQALREPVPTPTSLPAASSAGGGPEGAEGARPPCPGVSRCLPGSHQELTSRK
jgi:anthranilate synthase component I